MGLLDWVIGPECCKCGTREKVHHKDEMPTMGGTVRWWLCDDCFNKQLEEMKKKAEESAKSLAKQIRENERESYHKWLKREVEIVELEKRAQDLGMKNIKGKFDSGQV